MVNYLLVPGRMEKVVGLDWLQSWHLSGTRRPAARVGDLRRPTPSLVYLTPILGGIIADKLARPEHDVDRRRSADGARPFPDGDRRRVPVRAAGAARSASALFKGNIATQVGALYGPNDLRRAMAFQIFYIFINVSVIIAPLISGTLGQKVGWHYGFGCAGVVMVLGLIIYLSGRAATSPRASDAQDGRVRGGSQRRCSRCRSSRGTTRMCCRVYPDRTRSSIPVLSLCSLLTNQEIFNAYLVWGDQQFDLTLLNHPEQLADHGRCGGQLLDARRGRGLLEMVGHATIASRTRSAR